MKVILTQDVAGLGGIGDVVEVAGGYANNFLMPRQLAILATSGNLKHWQEKRGWIVKREAATKAEAEELAKQLEGARLTITAKSGEEGRLYGSVTVKDIATRILEDLKVDIDRKKIVLPEPIKTAGEHEATVRVYKDVEAKVVVDVIGEREEGGAVEEIDAEQPEQAAAAEEEAAGGAGDQPEA